MESGKCLVLSSGGLDSTTCVGAAVERFGKENVATVSFLYGQRHLKELECAQKVAAHYGVRHYVLNIAQILQYSDSAMLASGKDVPLTSYEDQIRQSGEGPVATYVPFRNGLMLSAAAALAGSLWPDDEVELHIGVHEGDSYGSSYPDCSAEFVGHMGNAIRTGTYGRVRVVAPLLDLPRPDKAGVVELGLRLKVPYELTWSCYLGGTRACGRCATCRERLAAFAANRVPDPIPYED